MTIERWDERSAEEIDEYGIFRVKRYLARSPRTGERRPFTILETADWVNVIALTPDDRVVLVRQFRHGLDDVSLEIPGGIIDPGEDPARAATRELREETGYEGSEPVFLGTVDPNPAIQTNRQHSFLIEDCRSAADQELDPGEDIAVVTMPRTEVLRAIADGRVSHALVVCAFWWLKQRNLG